MQTGGKGAAAASKAGNESNQSQVMGMVPCQEQLTAAPLLSWRHLGAELPLGCPVLWSCPGDTEMTTDPTKVTLE